VLLAEALGALPAVSAVDAVGATLLGAVDMLDDKAGVAVDGSVGTPDAEATDAAWDGVPPTTVDEGCAVLTADTAVVGTELAAAATGEVVLDPGLSAEAVAVTCAWFSACSAAFEHALNNGSSVSKRTTEISAQPRWGALSVTMGSPVYSIDRGLPK
jgi:hypothetical protein